MTFPSTFSENTTEFPMSMEVDESLLLNNTDFNRNFSPSDFIAKPRDGSYEINSLDMGNCDTKYNLYLNNSKSSQEERKPQKNRNGLIGNFDHNVLFDGLKSNSLNNNNGNELFLVSQDAKLAKDDSKSLMNSHHNFDTLFNHSLDNNQMDFESIIPYSSETHDSLFQIANGNFSNTSLFNNDEGMMNCEDLNF